MASLLGGWAGWVALLLAAVSSVRPQTVGAWSSLSREDTFSTRTKQKHKIAERFEPNPSGFAFFSDTSPPVMPPLNCSYECADDQECKLVKYTVYCFCAPEPDGPCGPCPPGGVEGRCLPRGPVPPEGQFTQLVNSS